MRSPYFNSLIASALLLGALAAHSAEPKYDHYVHLTPENSAIGNFPAQKQAILTIKSGQTVRIDTGGGRGWGDGDPDAWLKEKNIKATTKDTPALLETQQAFKEATRYGDIKTGHMLVGPIAIDGAMPGDTLEIRILSIVP